MQAKASKHDGSAYRIALLLLFAIALPSSITLPFESPKITPARGVILILFFPALATFVKGLAAGTRRRIASDVFVLLTCAWMFGAAVVTNDFAVAMVSANLIIMEFLGGYLIARAYFGSRDALGGFVSAFEKMMLFAVGVAVLDHVLGYNFVADSLSSAAFKGQRAMGEYRQGLLRAASTFDHPILYGILCALAVVVFWYGETVARRRALYASLAAFGCLLSMSSAALLACALGIGVIAYDRIMRSNRSRWALFWGAILVPMGLLFIFKDDPISTLIRYLTIDPQTGFFRLLIWEYAGAEVLGSPWVGIGFRDWVRMPGMGGSVDSLWLLQSMVFGIPSAVLLGLAFLTSIRSLRRSPRVLAPDPFIQRIRTGLTIVIMLTILMAFTVHFWGAMWTFLGVLTALRANVEEIWTRQRPDLPGAGQSSLPSRLLATPVAPVNAR